MSERHTTGGRIIAARETKGLSLRRAARRLNVSPRALRGWERGRTDVPLAVRQAMAVLYGTAPQYLVPERPSTVERDSGTAVLRIGSVAFKLEHSDDETLRRFLAAVREERGLAPGAALKVRDADAALLADILGGSAEEITRTLRRLLGVSETEAADFSRWIFGRSAVAGVFALGLTAGLAGTVAFAGHAPASTPGSSNAPATAVIVAHQADASAAAGSHSDPNWAEIGDAAVLFRDGSTQNPTP
jgi:transcriptional regulator with XRE-family HTH domain